ncbi:o-succinylbenzoate synthase [Leuconostoc koreense]|nr:o-succinylbenzoate synthase [Leuconostoc mesenteroides]QGM25596.1 o-succinylbenzoate synthase [Leuconostoc mesenteroides subsp. mesenteroides]
MYQIKKITLIPIALTMLQAFKTAHHSISKRPLTIVTIELMDEKSGEVGLGYGEVQSFADFSYTLENQHVSREILKNVLLPQIRSFSFSNPQSFSIRLNELTPFASFAKAGLEMAVWDAIGKLTHQSLQQMIQGQGVTVPVGIAVGMADSIDEALAQGYQRIKLKIDAHVVDFEHLNRLLKKYPEQQFSIDANSSFTDENIVQINKLPENVIFIEQPLGENDFVQHAILQAHTSKIISLDESINNLNDVATMLTCRSAKALTIKQGKIGGISSALKAIQLVDKPWVGGMLASGLGRSVDIAISSLPKIAFPGDISDSSRYFERDIIEECLRVNHGNISVPRKYGVGVTVDLNALSDLQTEKMFTITD